MIKKRIINWLLGYNLENFLNRQDEQFCDYVRSHEKSCSTFRKQIEDKNKEVLNLKNEVSLLKTANKSLDSKIVMVESENKNLQDKNRNSFLADKISEQNMDTMRLEISILKNRLKESELIETTLKTENVELKTRIEIIRKINHEMVKKINRGRIK